MQEIRFLKHLSGHTNIVQFITAASTSPEKAISGKTEFLVCMELCSGRQNAELKSNFAF